MDFNVFYSWQSDTPYAVNRDLIKEAATDAVERIRNDAIIQESPRLDQDTKGVPGMPELAATIFRKIDNCGIFLADVTFVASTASCVPKNAKKVPNPNVLLELGYAAAKVGWERIICVMNTFYGKPRDQIFDIRHRRYPFCFKADPENTVQDEGVQRQLSEDIEGALRTLANNEHEGVKGIVARLDEPCLRLMDRKANVPYFPGPKPGEYSLGGVDDTPSVNQAITRLLDLGLIVCDAKVSAGKYAYHWTYFGDLALRELGFRKAD